MKMFKKIGAIALSAILLLNIIPNKTIKANTGDWPIPPEIYSENAILIDADTGEILYEKDAYAKSFPASVTKIITALLTIENCNLGDTVTFSYEAAHSYEPGDSNIGIWANEQLTVEQTLRAIIMESANEACYGIAEYISGDVPTFVNLMNERAKQLGALDTHFTNTNGLHDNNHYTTAYDLAMIGRACFNNTTFMEMCSDTATYEIAPTNKYKTIRYLRNKHKLLKNRAYEYEYALGGKTGYTEEAGHTLISFAKKDGVRLICVVMRSAEEERYKDTRALFEYGFNNFSKTAITNETFATYTSTDNSGYVPKDFFMGSGKVLELESNMYVLLPLGADENEIKASCSFDSGTFATCNFTYRDHLLAKANVIVSSQTSKGASNLPLISENESKTVIGKQYKVINFWIVLGIFLVVALIICTISHLLILNKTEYGQNLKIKRRNKKRRRR